MINLPNTVGVFIVLEVLAAPFGYEGCTALMNREWWRAVVAYLIALPLSIVGLLILGIPVLGRRWTGVTDTFLIHWLLPLSSPYLVIIVPISVLIYFFHQKIARMIASVRSVPVLVGSQEQTLRDAVRPWLKSRLAASKLQVEHAGLFGSILRDHYTTSDVDLAVLVKPVTEKRFGRIAACLRGVVARDFKESFGHRLQVQFFSANDIDAFNTFCTDDKFEALF